MKVFGAYCRYMVDRLAARSIHFISAVLSIGNYLKKKDLLGYRQGSIKEGFMDKKQFVLAALAPANGAVHTPVQVQKLLFILQEEIPEKIGGVHFNFEPYDYGPFDSEVYRVLEILSVDGLVEIIPGKWNSYRLTELGQERAKASLDGLEPQIKTYLQSLSKFVRNLSFPKLVSAIYKNYPGWDENSVFQG
ncbi:MAG: hypothetical protein ACE5EK_01755 [Nitrospinales bacterium]